MIKWNQNLDAALYSRFLVLNFFLLIVIITLKVKKDLIQINYNKWFLIFTAYIFSSSISLLISKNIPDALFRFSNITSFGILVFILYNIQKKKKIDFKTLSIFFIIITDIILIKLLVEFVDILNTTGINHQIIYKINAGFSHKNILSEILLVLLPFSLFSISWKNITFKIIGILNSLIILFFITVLMTRAVWIALFAGGLISIITFLITSNKFFSIKKTLKILFLVISSSILIILASILFYSKQDTFDTFKKSFQKIFVSYDSSKHRYELWNRTIDIFKSHPAFGVGLSMWKIEVLKYGNRNLASEDNVTFYQRPHNDYLWVLSEQGIIGFIFYFLSLLLILKYLFDLIRKSNDKTEYFFLILILFSYVGYLSFSFFAFPNERIEHQVFLAIIFSFILVKTDKNSITNNKTQNLVLFIIISITVFSSIFIGYHRVKSEYYLKKAFEARYTKSWNKEIKYLNKSESYFYKIDPFSTPLSWYRGEAYFNLNNLEKAYTDFKNAYKINPNHIHVLNNLATCYVLKGENNEAKELYKKAIELSPTFKEAILNITAVYFNQNQIDSAIFYLTKYKGPSSDEKYKNYLLTVLKSKINKIKESCSDALIINILEKILLNNEWIVNIFEKSKEKNINFENQILKDAIYTLENIDNKISKEESKLLLSKYNL